MTERLPDAAENDRWLREHERIIAEFFPDIPCTTGKKGYARKADALTHARGVKDRTGSQQRISAFRCGYCGLFHVGRNR